MVLMFSFLGCTPGTGILALGDSVLEWNGRDAIPEVAAQSMGLDAQNNAVGGTRLTGDIPETYESGDWSWVLVDGGANDLNDECGCTGCGYLIDEMVSSDGGSGVMVDLLGKITSDGHQMAILGYYMVPDDAPEFTNCSDEVVTLNSRFSALAEQHDDVIYIAAAEVMAPSQRNLYDDDLIHPSEQGSRVVGEYMAQQMRQFDRR